MRGAATRAAGRRRRTLVLGVRRRRAAQMLELGTMTTSGTGSGAREWPNA
jgi:hypothetical protein